MEPKKVELSGAGLLNAGDPAGPLFGAKLSISVYMYQNSPRLMIPILSLL